MKTKDARMLDPQLSTAKRQPGAEWVISGPFGFDERMQFNFLMCVYTNIISVFRNTSNFLIFSDSPNVR